MAKKEVSRVTTAVIDAPANRLPAPLLGTLVEVRVMTGMLQPASLPLKPEIWAVWVCWKVIWYSSPATVKGTMKGYVTLPSKAMLRQVVTCGMAERPEEEPEQEKLAK